MVITATKTTDQRQQLLIKITNHSYQLIIARLVKKWELGVTSELLHNYRRKLHPQGIIIVIKADATVEKLLITINNLVISMLL